MPLLTYQRFSVASMLFLTALIFGASAEAQNGCSLIDKSRRPQFIGYEGVSDSSQNVRLRLRNNSTCAIIVIVAHPPRRLVKTPRVRFEEISGGADGIRIDPYYLLHHRWQQTVREAYAWGDEIYTYEILGGQSVVFDVPLSTFRKKLDVAVPFNYSWDSHGITTATGGVEHQIYFLFDDVPDVVLKQSRRRK
jgi:hypothetical protein